MCKRVLVFVLLAGLSASCRHSATQLVVLVDTDYAVPGELSDLRVEVSAEDGTDPSFQDFAISGRDESMPPRFAIPLSFGVVPIGDDASRRVLIDVRGLAPGGGQLVTRRARTGFLANRSLLLPIFLLRSCEGVVCPDGETCDDAVCVPDEVDPLLLRPIDPGGERDAGLTLIDAGDRMDSGTDGGLDAGPDAGLGDSGPPDAGPLDGGVSGPRFVRHIASGTCGGTGTDVSITEAVPVGATLVVAVAWRGGAAESTSASDSRLNDYRQVVSPIADNPTGALLVGTITTRLEPGDTVSVMHPTADAMGVVIDELAGVRGTPVVSFPTREFNRSVAVPITTPSPGLIYAALASFNNTPFTVTGGWLTTADVPMMCPTGFGDFDMRTFQMTGAAGRHELTGDFSARRSWVAILAVFDAP